MITRYKECNKCGKLKKFSSFHLRTIYKGKPVTETSYKSICKSCVTKNVIEWKEKNRDKVRALDKKYRNRDRDKLNKWKRDNYSEGGRSKKERDNYKSNRDNLTDVYLKGLLTQSMGVSSKDIPNDIVKLKRKHLSLWRKLKLKSIKNGKEKHQKTRKTS